MFLTTFLTVDTLSQKWQNLLISGRGQVILYL